MGFENVSEELKNQAKNCTTGEELVELTEKEGAKFSDEVLDAVSGGASPLVDEGIVATCRLG